MGRRETTRQNTQKRLWADLPRRRAITARAILARVMAFLKKRTRFKDGKKHEYYSLCESLRLGGSRIVQRDILHLGELNASQLAKWKRTIAVLHEDGSLRQTQLFTDEAPNGEHHASQPPRNTASPSPAPAPSASESDADIIEVKLSTLALKRPRRFGDCFAACRAWEQLGLRAFWDERLAAQPGDIPWAKVLELLAVNRLIEPRSELSIHEKFFPQTALDILLDTDARVAGKDRLYRCLDRITAHKTALETHLAQKWKDLFNATHDILLYDLTSTYIEGAGSELPDAKRGYSRDHRPDCLQLVLALVVTPEGFPLTYEIFPGNTLDHTTLARILDAVEQRHGKARRVWVFDRGIVTEENLKLLRESGAYYLVGTPKNKLRAHEQKLLDGPWQNASAEVQVQLLPENDETYILCRSAGRREKEAAMRRRAEAAAIHDLRKLRQRIATGKLKNATLIHEQIGRLRERHPAALKHIEPTYHPATPATDATPETPATPARPAALSWKWNLATHKTAVLREGAYLLRAHWPGMDKDPEKLWQTYTQLTNAEAAFRVIKTEVKVRPIWHWTPKRVEAHIMVAFMGYCLWVYLKKSCESFAPSLTPWALLDQLRRIQLVEVWFETRDGRHLCLPRITQPELGQKVLMEHLGWKLPEQPPPRVYAQPEGKEGGGGE